MVNYHKVWAHGIYVFGDKGFSDTSNHLVKDKDILQELVRTPTCLKTKS